MNYQILPGDNRETLKTIPDNSIDAIVTDPPYGIDFLGKAWDANTGALETYQQCLRVLKPGGHILAFSASRTYHHLAITLEQAGFEIRDQIMWIYSSGFPKSQDVGRSIQRSLGVKQTKKNPAASKATFNNVLSEAQDKQRDNSTDDSKPGSAEQIVCTDPEAKAWEGWGTALKPAHEPIALARKPMRLSIARNCQTHGVGALNINATRIAYDGPSDIPVPHGGKARQHKDNPGWMSTTGHGVIENPEINAIGRFPSNVLGEIPDYQKYFYCPKVNRAERHVGFDGNETYADMCASVGAKYIANATILPGIGLVKDHGLKHEIQKIRGYETTGNNHPTVKPIELMKYLIKLITPPGGTVLDPFNGSGSTGCAAVELGHPYIGCELDARYVEISTRRIEAWYEHTNPTTFRQLFEQE